jgi:hypothetical protein
MSEDAVAPVELGVRQRRVVAERGQAIRHPDVGDVDQSHLGSGDFGVVGPKRATSQLAVEPSREVAPTSRRRLARHNT